jgi:hypothetical protein
VSDDIQIIPDWVPCAVANVAPHMPRTVADRLLHDDRMKVVWKRLRARPSHDVARRLEDLEQNVMKFSGLLDEDVLVPLSDQACAAFFISVAWRTGSPSPRHVWTRVKAENQAVRWEAAGALCQSVASDPMFAKHQAAATEMADFFQKNATSLKERGYLADLDQQVKPYVLGRSSRRRGNDDDVRAHTRAIAADARRIFGSWLYGTVATVATAASC